MYYIIIIYNLFRNCVIPGTGAVCFFIFIMGCKNNVLPDYPVTKEVSATRAGVVTAHPAATKIGVDILKNGGNAADAAIAVQFALAVCYPRAGNLGGGGFLLYRDSSGE